MQAFSREAILWSQVKHPNVLPFYGVYQLDDMYHKVCLVSPWMENGNLREYLATHPQTDRLLLVSSTYIPIPTISDYIQARGVARGLRYLHDRNIIHGDLKGVGFLSASTFLAFERFFHSPTFSSRLQLKHASVTLASPVYLIPPSFNGRQLGALPTAAGQ